MSTSNNNYFHPSFSHIYVEKTIFNHPRTQQILSHFTDAKIIFIDHYKDIFSRSRQNPSAQYESRALILAQKTDGFLYPGAPFCQDFNESHFYYSSCIMNCLYQCEYCYLKGMYSSSHIVIFVNLEDYFAAFDQLLLAHPAYICISYDTDLVALDKITHFIPAFLNYADSHPTVRFEIRTKAAPIDFWSTKPKLSNVIYSFTLSPDEVIHEYEHYTPPLTQRLDCIASGLMAGYPIRLCFDPLIYFFDWQNAYSKMLQLTAQNLDLSQITEISVGTFRMNKDYLKKMRHAFGDNKIIFFPFENKSNISSYPDDIEQKLLLTFLHQLYLFYPKEKIFIWDKMN